MDKATQKSIEWQKANHPMAIGGDAFADMVDSFNVNPAFVAGYKEAEKDTLERAIQWLIIHADDYIVDMEVSRYKPSNLHVGGMCWEHLKQVMEEE